MVSRSRVVVAASLFLLVVSAGEKATAQAFKYVDENGRVHFTDNYARVPPKFRDQVEERKMSSSETPARKSSSPSPSRRAATRPGELDGLGRLLANALIFLADEDGEPMTLTEKRAVEGWAADWGWAALWAATISSLIIMGMVVHAFITDRKMWGVLNFVFGFTAVPYMFMYVEKPLAVRFGMFLGACSPIPVFFALFSRLVATV
ncbi:MAG: DUF4124 domain-containing protein [Planctomycetota bacterium]